MPKTPNLNSHVLKNGHANLNGHADDRSSAELENINFPQGAYRQLHGWEVKVLNITKELNYPAALVLAEKNMRVNNTDVWTQAEEDLIMPAYIHSRRTLATQLLIHRNVKSAFNEGSPYFSNLKRIVADELRTQGLLSEQTITSLFMTTYFRVSHEGVNNAFNSAVRKLFDKFGAFQLANKHLKQLEAEELPIPSYLTRFLEYETFRHTIMMKNSRLSWHFARKRQPETRERHQLETGDYHSAGMDGHIEALDKLEADKSNRYVTYATWWVKQRQAQEFQGNATTVKVGRGVLENLRVARLAAGRLGYVDIHPTNFEEILLELDTMKREGQAKLAANPNAKRTGAKINITMGNLIAAYKAISQNSVSADEMHEGDFNLQMALTAKGDNVDELAHRAALLEKFWKHLRPRERKVLELRFGLEDNAGHSLEQIGRLLRISKERVRQIQARAIEKLRKLPEVARENE